MDDMKKAAYILAKELLETGKSSFACLALQDALSEILEETVPASEIPEMFPEFYNLFDGFYWTQSGNKYEKDSYLSVWWKINWIEPRVRIIDMLMSQG
jgi:hypothetical protein